MLEEFVCQLYGHRSKSTDGIRYKIYKEKYTKENKITDMATLPPCSSVLRLHILRANMVAAVWKHSTSVIVELPDISICGWLVDGNIQWVEDIFPSEIEDILLHDDYNEEDDLCIDENDGLSDDEEEEF